MELFTKNLASTFVLLSWVTLCLIALIVRASHVERQTRRAEPELYSPFRPK